MAFLSIFITLHEHHHHPPNFFIIFWDDGPTTPMFSVPYSYSISLPFLGNSWKSHATSFLPSWLTSLSVFLRFITLPKHYSFSICICWNSAGRLKYLHIWDCCYKNCMCQLMHVQIHMCRVFFLNMIHSLFIWTRYFLRKLEVSERLSLISISDTNYRIYFGRIIAFASATKIQS